MLNSESAASEFVPTTIVPIDSIRRDPNNAKIHATDSIASIKGSLKAHGQVAPLLVYDGIVIGGNGCHQAMSELGFNVVEIRDLTGTTSPEKARALAIALNKTAEYSQWNEEVLERELRELSASVSEAALSDMIGVSEGELAELLKESEPAVKAIDYSDKPPVMAWVLIGIPTVRYGEIAAQIESLSKIEGVCCDVAVNSGT